MRWKFPKYKNVYTFYVVGYSEYLLTEFHVLYQLLWNSFKAIIEATGFGEFIKLDIGIKEIDIMDTDEQQ